MAFVLLGSKNTETLLLGALISGLLATLLIVGAAVMGVVTVWLTEMLSRTRLLAGDAAIGVVFPLLFPIAIILITRYAGSVHLDTDSVLLGELAFAPALVHYGLMTLVSLTTVGAFQAVGSVLVVAFLIGPPVTAYLLTDDLKRMLILSGAIGAANGVLGYQAAALLGVSIAGSMAVVTGLTFLSVFVFSPRRGLISSLLRRKK